MSIRRLVLGNPLLSATVLAGVVALGCALAGATGPAQWISLIFAGIIGVYLAVGMVIDIVHGHWGVDVLAVTAIGATLAVGEYAAAMVIVLMLTGGEALETYAGARAKRELTGLMESAPRAAHLVDGDGIRDVPIETVQPGMILLVRPSEVVPVDGTLDDERGVFDESSLTGESLPVERYRGDPVLSGAINGTVAVTIRAGATAAESQYAQIIELVRTATESKSRIMRLADRYAVPFTALAYVIAALAWVLSGDPVRFAAVLVVATPCPLLIATPVALLGGMSRAAKAGIIVKNGTALEIASRVRTVAFDKTGTLTQGRPELRRVITTGALPHDEVLAYAAAAEQYSSHVLAASITQAAISRGLELPLVTRGEEIATHGVRAVIDGREVLVGKPGFVLDGVGGGADPQTVAPTDGALAVHVGVADSYVGALLLADPPRAESAATVARLRAAGISHVVMLTGDASASAQAVGEAVGIDDIRSGLLPADKVHAVTEVTDRPVMMVGDGVNDAPVLAVAELGVAMGARGATAAAESALAVLLADRIDGVAELVTIGRRTVRVALQSIWLGIGLSVVLMLLAAAGQLPPLAGALSQELVDLVAIGNALRALSPGRRV